MGKQLSLFSHLHESHSHGLTSFSVLSVSASCETNLISLAGALPLSRSSRVGIIYGEHFVTIELKVTLWLRWRATAVSLLHNIWHQVGKPYRVKSLFRIERQLQTQSNFAIVKIILSQSTLTLARQSKTELCIQWFKTQGEPLQSMPYRKLSSGYLHHRLHQNHRLLWTRSMYYLCWLSLFSLAAQQCSWWQCEGWPSCLTGIVFSVAAGVEGISARWSCASAQQGFDTLFEHPWCECIAWWRGGLRRGMVQIDPVWMSQRRQRMPLRQTRHAAPTSTRIAPHKVNMPNPANTSTATCVKLLYTLWILSKPKIFNAR